mgnify:FL=1
MQQQVKGDLACRHRSSASDVSDPLTEALRGEEILEEATVPLQL